MIALLVFIGCSDRAFFVRNDGADLPVWRRGPEDAGTLLLVTHGLGASGRFYDELPAFDRLEDELAVVYWDQRGAGNSQGNAPRDTLTVDALLEDLDLVRDAVEARWTPDRLVLLGHSLGGGLSTAYLTEPDARVGIDGYVDVAGARNAEQAFDDVRALMSEEARAAGLDDLVTFYDTVQDLPQDPATRAQHVEHTVTVNALRGWDQPAADARLRSFVLGRSLGASFMGSFDVLAFLGNTARFHDAFDFRTLAVADDELDGVDLPTLFVSGRYDLAVPTSFSRTTSDAMAAGRDTRFLELEAGHWPMFDQPDRFADAVLEFTSGL